MRPQKLEGGSWHAIDSNRMLQHFKQEVVAALRERGRARGIPLSGACGKWIHRGNDATFQVDPRLSALKHSGEEASREWVKRWQAFCSEPRDPLTELSRIGERPQPDETPRTNIHGLSETVEAAIARGIQAGLAAAQTNGHDKPNEPARPVGRPRKLEPVAEEST
jgi:hypothetical protein